MWRETYFYIQFSNLNIKLKETKVKNTISLAQPALQSIAAQNSNENQGQISLRQSIKHFICNTIIPWKEKGRRIRETHRVRVSKREIDRMRERILSCLLVVGAAKAYAKTNEWIKKNKITNPKMKILQRIGCWWIDAVNWTKNQSDYSRLWSRKENWICGIQLCFWEAWRWWLLLIQFVRWVFLWESYHEVLDNIFFVFFIKTLLKNDIFKSI